MQVDGGKPPATVVNEGTKACEWKPVGMFSFFETLEAQKMAALPTVGT